MANSSRCVMLYPVSSRAGRARHQSRRLAGILDIHVPSASDSPLGTSCLRTLPGPLFCDLDLTNNAWWPGIIELCRDRKGGRGVGPTMHLVINAVLEVVDDVGIDRVLPGEVLTRQRCCGVSARMGIPARSETARRPNEPCRPCARSGPMVP